MSISLSSSLLQTVFNSSHGGEKISGPTGFWLENFSGKTYAIIFTILGGPIQMREFKAASQNFLLWAYATTAWSEFIALFREAWIKMSLRLSFVRVITLSSKCM